MDSSLTVQDCAHKRTHRRSAAVSLDLDFKRTFSNSRDLGKTLSSSAVDQVIDNPESRTAKQKKKDNKEELLVLPNSKTSTKKRTGFHGWFWAESILSLAYLYFGGSHKKKVSTSSVPVVLNVEEHPPPSSICTVTLQPLIDLDAALLTKPSNSSLFTASEKSQRPRRVTVSSPYLSELRSTCHSSYKNGYSLKRKMSVIIEDADVISTSLQPSSEGVSDTLENVQIPTEQSMQVVPIDGEEAVFAQEEIEPNRSENVLNDDQPIVDVYDFFPEAHAGDTIDHDNTLIGIDEQGTSKSIEGKRKWRRILGKFLKKKSR